MDTLLLAIDSLELHVSFRRVSFPLIVLIRLFTKGPVDISTSSSSRPLHQP